MLLSKLLSPLLKYQAAHFKDVEITSITTDSRRVAPGGLFIAIRGYTVDGHRFLDDAAARGAVAFLVEEIHEGVQLPQIKVQDTGRASAVLADMFYDHPSRRIAMVGVTGTNGKTTVTHLIEAILQDADNKTGLIGTVENRIDGMTIPSVNTTPESVELQGLFAQMADRGCAYGIMEVSSHALELGRVAGTRFHIAVFTNLTQDHLDFHQTMDAYRNAKGKLFSRLGNSFGDSKSDMSYGVLNVDDETSKFFESETVMECVTYGIENNADIQAFDVQVEPQGVSFHVKTFCGEANVRLKITGRFNVYNAMAAMAVGLIEGIPLHQVVQSLECVPGVPGRLEPVICHQGYAVLVDYAHTPDSLQNALSTIQEFAKSRIITVIGCGGDRDKTKRPLMAQAAVARSQVTILTSDNPRTEEPEAILDDMEAGLRGTHGNYERITDRREAIFHAISLAKVGDVVLIAGKGHEDYQIVGKTKHHFDDREIARLAIQARQTSDLTNSKKDL